MSGIILFVWAGVTDASRADRCAVKVPAVLQLCVDGVKSAAQLIASGRELTGVDAAADVKPGLFVEQLAERGGLSPQCTGVDGRGSGASEETGGVGAGEPCSDDLGWSEPPAARRTQETVAPARTRPQPDPGTKAAPGNDNATSS